MGRKHIWKDYFSKLLGSNPSHNVKQIKAIREDDLQIKTGPFTINELIVLKNIKLKKTAGMDEIPHEVWIKLLFNSHLLIFCNEVYN